MYKVFCCVLLQVKELGKSSLPSWLTLDASSGLLQGVPSTDQLDQEFFLEVTTASGDGATQASDVFSIKVQEDTVHLDSAATKLAETKGIRPIKCPPGSSVTMATVIVDVDLGAMMAKEKVDLMRGMCSHLNLPHDVLRVVPVGDKPMFDSSALVAGPGDVKQARYPGAMIQWEVGCGNVHAHHMPILQHVETSSGDGTMGKAIENGIVGWHVTNNRPHTPVRLKRQVRVQPTPTPMPTGVPPSRRPVPTGTEVRPTRTDKPRKSRTKSRHHKSTRKPKKTKTRRPSIMPTTTHLPVEPTDTDGHTPSEVLPPHQSRPGVIEPSMRPTMTMPTTPTEELSSTVLPHPDETGHPEPTKTEDSGEATMPVDEDNEGPTLRREIKNIEVQVGDLLEFKVPAGTFSDVEDGNTRSLKLVFGDEHGLSLPPDSWVHFNATTQSLFGLPMAEDKGRHRYKMTAIDSGGKIAEDVFEIFVQRNPNAATISHEFSVAFDMDYNEFMVDVRKRVEVAGKIASVYGDSNMDKIAVTRIAPGSVIYAWANNSVPTEPCPYDAISKLLEFLITSNNTLNETFVEKMRPYKVMKAGVQPKGSCTEPETPEPEGKPEPEPEDPTDKVAVEVTGSDDGMLKVIVPILIIAAFLLIAICVACVLYQKKKKKEKEKQADKTFMNKGIPVIFADEMEDKPDPPTKPLMADHEAPPASPPPPGYQRSAGGSMVSTPPSDQKEPLLTSDDDGEDTIPYKPPSPPVSTGSLGSKDRHSQPPARQPPPYVPP